MKVPSNIAYQTCPGCIEYVARRGPVVAKAIPAAARKNGVSPRRMAHLYFGRVHDRHTSGLSLGAPPP